MLHARGKRKCSRYARARASANLRPAPFIVSFPDLTPDGLGIGPTSTCSVRQHHVHSVYNERAYRWTSSTVEVVLQQLRVSLKRELSSADGLVE